MAITDTERAQIRRALGYWDQTQGFYSKLEGTIFTVSAEGELQIRQYLTEIAEIDVQIREARMKRIKASRVEDIHVAGPDEILMLYHEGNRLCRQISLILGVPVLHFPFAVGDVASVAGRT